MKQTQYYSYKTGKLPKGCQLCVKGSKLVLFVTGLCPRCCYFCPISDEKYGKDVVYADEWRIKNVNDIIKEAKLISAAGAGFTGGDPLCKLSRTLNYIKVLKKEFGKKFHIHLYTSLDLIDKKTLDKLYNAGLDEIRFHLDFKDHKLWNKLELALDYKWDVGVEIPAIPKNKNDIKKIILNLNGLNKKFKKKLFLNLNELEIADNKVNKLLKLGYKPKNELSYAVNGSEELALNLLNFVEKNRLEINVHYCTATLKDKVQLANRIKRRAKNIAKAYDKITQDGTLIRGSIYLSSLKPGFKYREKIKKIVNNTKLKNKYLAELKIIKDNIKKDFKVKNIEVDKNKLRILTSVKEVKKIRDIIDKNLLKNITKDKKLLKNKDLSLAIVEEYPTYDQIELNVEFL
jgi:hypothetical protein